MAEYFDVLDEFGNKTGQVKPRVDVHRDGDWHREVHIWIVNDKNEVLLQKRAPNKDHCPNMWDISVGGHIGAGDESIASAIRETKEEIGVDITADQLQFLGTLRGTNSFGPVINNKFDDVYLMRLNIDIDKIVFLENEISEVCWMPVSELKDMVARRDPMLTMLYSCPQIYDVLFDAIIPGSRHPGEGRDPLPRSEIKKSNFNNVKNQCDACGAVDPGLRRGDDVDVW